MLIRKIQALRQEATQQKVFIKLQAKMMFDFFPYNLKIQNSKKMYR